MPPIIKLKFSKIYHPLYESTVLPNGYRLATVEEVRNNLHTITRLKLVERLYDSPVLLLDGYIFRDSSIERAPDEYCDRVLVVKEKEWNEDARIWKKKKSACYSSNGILLRTQLYDGITLSQQSRETALLVASHYGHTEVLYWLLKTTNPTEFDGFGSVFREEARFPYSCTDMVGSLLASKFPLQLPLEDENGKNPLDYAIEVLRNNLREGSFCILVVELFIEVYSVNIVHTPTREGVSFLDTATQNEWIPVLTKLLSILSQPSVSGLENQISKIKPRFGDVLIEAVERGYRQLAEDLLELQDCIEQITADVCSEVLGGAVRKGYMQCMQKMLEPVFKKKAGNELQLDKHGKTLFHYAAETDNSEVFQLLAKSYQDEYKEKKRDKCGRNFLHWAALNGEANCCRDCIDEWKLKADAKDNWGQNSLHFSAKGNNGHQVVDILIKSSSLDLIYSRDDKGRTPLHTAAANGNLKMISKLLSLIALNASQVHKYIQLADSFGTTALQLAAVGGHTRIVQLFLDNDCDPLEVRDIRGMTALNYATQAKDAEIAVAISERLLNKYGDSVDKKSLLLWASAAAGIGTAEEDLNQDVKDFLLREKERYKEDLLRAAAINNNVEMAWELLNRGANIAHIYDQKWRETLQSRKEKNVKSVINQIEIAKDQGRDKPSHEDNLGRSIFAEGLAALFLNRFVESPITVGICGEWGMGKSSLMIQTENILLMAASQLAFPNLLPYENFVGVQKISLNTKGQKIYQKIKNGVHNLLSQEENYSELGGLFSRLVGFSWKIYERIIRKENPLVELLEKYHPQYHAIYKSLACSDLPNLTTRSNVETPALESQYQTLRGAPRILTIRYNAWHYRDEHEAWAGLAVTITKEIEQAMTRAQKFSTCWKYSWIKNSVHICLQIFLPCLLVTFLAGWMAWAAWTLLKDAEVKDLRYGSIPCTIIAIVWVVLKSVISVVKPVSTQMMGYIVKPDHTSRLGYQQQVISDINFLKGELGKRPHLFFSFISGGWCWNWFGMCADNVENTCVPKFSPASEEQVRIITFVDDLDRCDEKVILQVLSAINLVLAECKINVILGMDKSMIERAIRRNFEDNDDKDLADKYICKIIQIPLSLPDPTDEESDEFLRHQLRCSPRPVTTAAALEDGEETDYGEIDSDNDVDGDEISQRSMQETAVDVDIGGSATENAAEIPRQESTDCFNELKTSCQGITKKVLQCLRLFFQILCLLASNISNEDDLNDEEIRPLKFSKGARLTREMLLSNYTTEEAETFYKLKKFATGNHKLPREWKLLLNYRILASNILCMIGKVYKLPEWKVELVAWIFICWQWKHEMNTIFKGWHRYTAVTRSTCAEDKNGRRRLHGPSLAEIVAECVRELENSRQSKQSKRSSKKKREAAILKLKGSVSKQESPFLCLQGHYENISEEGESQYNWSALQSALKAQNVSMKGIQMFQQFRLHCQTDHLPWPPHSNEPT